MTAQGLRWRQRKPVAFNSDRLALANGTAGRMLDSVEKKRELLQRAPYEQRKQQKPTPIWFP